MVTNLEELSLNAWTAFQTVLYDGWFLRFANGYTRRANSVNALYPSTRDVDEKILFCEDIYQARKLAVTFKITPAVYPSNLDEKLTEKGYRKDAPTSVQILELEKLDLQVASSVNIQEQLSDQWLDDFCRMSVVAQSDRELARQILINIIPRHCFISLRQNNQVVACGLGVLQSEHIGLFDIVTDHNFRGRGYGQQVVKSILAWGKQNGAHQAYLQVMLNNAPALHLYSKIGFIENYQYWYRIKS